MLDPPKFAPTAAHAERAARAYKDINRLALKLLAPGGVLFTFSCSGGIGAELFHKIVAGAGIDAGVDAAILQRLEEGPDHPTTLLLPRGAVPEGPGAAEAVSSGRAQALRQRTGQRDARLELRAVTLKKLFTLRTFASCVNRRCTSAW